MNHKDTIKKIQGLVPDVMKLEFGCRIEIPIYHTFNSRSNGTFWRMHRLLTIDSLSGDLILNRDCRYGNKRVTRNSEMQILGKPITLAVVLRAILKHNHPDSEADGLRLDSDIIFLIKDCFGFKGWDLLKDDFNDQSEKTKDFVGELLK